MIEGEMMIHVAYCDDKEQVLEKIMNKTKTMIIRSAVGRKIPHSRVFKGEVIYLMKKGTSKITAVATVKQVENYTKLTEEEINQVLLKHEAALNLSKNERKRWHKQCICLVEIENIKPIDALDFDHKKNMDDWLIIEKIEDVLVKTSIPYNYEKSKF